MSLESPSFKRVEKMNESKEVREEFFAEIIREGILSAMLDALEEAGFTPEETDEFEKQLRDLSVQDQAGVLSVPHELRQFRLEKLHERVAKGEPISVVIGTLVEDARKHGFSLGYHVSNAEILPQTLPDGRESWRIDGREPDHRDDDLPRAYYSTDLSHLYSKKRARFLYAIRAIQGEDTTHRQDNDGTWGRASKLDIIEKFDLDTILREIERRVQNRDSSEKE